MDKQSLILIVFIVMTVTITGILVTGLVPQIFKTGEQVNQTQQTLNQTQLFLMEQHARDEQTRHEDQARLNQTLHEDEAREKQNALENEARDKQRYLIINETNNSINILEEHLFDFIRESENRSETGAEERHKILEKLDTAITTQQAQLSFHDSQLKVLEAQHDTLQNITKMLVNLTEEDTAGALIHRNLTSALYDDVQKIMLEILDNSTRN